jgi:Flp pilus assembly secretin CpaC
MLFHVPGVFMFDRISRTVAVAVLIAGLMAIAQPAAAAQGSVLVNANQARVLRLNAPAATVIIGNPGVADVTIQDPQTLILTGKTYGQTNLIVLDAAGNPIADTLIEVIRTQAEVVTVFNGQAQMTLACEPVCQITATLGDDPGITARALTSAIQIENAAQ